jgi:hypothetical protein
VREREELGNQDFAGPSVKLDQLTTEDTENAENRRRA